MPGKVALYTLGCKLNFSETSIIGEQFASKGFEIVDYNETADIYVLNTCTVTGTAEKECRQYVRKALRLNPCAFIIVMGCYAQLRPEEISSIEGVDVILGTNDKFNLFSLINDFSKNDHSCVYVSNLEEDNSFGFAHSSETDERTRAFFKIQDGCDYKCSYCTIPKARGRSRSMLSEDVITEFKLLLEKGYKEIVLTGVNVGDYSDNNKDLYKLLLDMINIDSDFRIRISSIEPNLLTNNILELTAKSEKLCNHFHIPLQSGSDKILKLMKRRYNLTYYEDLIERAHKIIPDVGIGVDVISGFPGESDEDFLDTYNFLKDLPISYLHCFTYSERPDTQAIMMENSVPHVIRKKRTNMLRMLSAKKKNSFYTIMQNKKVKVLFESKGHEGFIKGFSSNYIRTALPYNDRLVNNFANVELINVQKDFCTGKLLDK